MRGASFDTEGVQARERNVVFEAKVQGGALLPGGRAALECRDYIDYTLPLRRDDLATNSTELFPLFQAVSLSIRGVPFTLPLADERRHMPSFDTVSEANMVEVRNALDQSNKEITTRFDFKGSDARIELKEHELTAFADSDFQLQQVRDILNSNSPSVVSTCASSTSARSRRSAATK